MSDSDTAILLRQMVRLYVRAQSLDAACYDSQSSVQCHILSELARNSPLTQQQLAVRLALDKGWVSRAVDALTTQGLLLRQAHPEDKRSALLELSAIGHDRATQLDQRLNQHAASVLSELSAASTAALPQALSELIRNLESQLSLCNANKKNLCRKSA